MIPIFSFFWPQTCLMTREQARPDHRQNSRAQPPSFSLSKGPGCIQPLHFCTISTNWPAMANENHKEEAMLHLQLVPAVPARQVSFVRLPISQPPLCLRFLIS